MEQAISKLLKIGVVISVSFLVVGALLLFIEPKQTPFDVTYSYINGLILEQFFSDLFSLKSAPFFLLGTLFLLMTPVARIILSFSMFFKNKNYAFVLISGVSLVVILASVFLKLMR